MARLFFSLVAAFVRVLPPTTVAMFARLMFSKTQRQLEQASADVEAAQRERLRSQLSRCQATDFGRKHNFAEILEAPDVVAEFRARVPLQTWDDVSPWVDRMLEGERDVLVPEDVFFYATTSGTTGHRKLVPITSAFIEEARVATRLLARTTLTEIPGAIQGKRLQMRSPSVEELKTGIYAGSITVALAGTIPGADDEGARAADQKGALDALPPAVFEVSDFRTRYFLCIRLAASEDVRMVSAINPSTLLLFAQTLAERGEEIAEALESGSLGADLELTDSLRARLAPHASYDVEAAARIRKSMKTHGAARMADLFPRLAGLVCWKGGSAPWYVSRLPTSYGKLPILDYGYAASEGIFGAPISTDGAASLLLPHGHFFEFFRDDDDANARPLGLHELEVSCRYEVVVTTGAGLFRYRMHDVIEVTGHHVGERAQTGGGETSGAETGGAETGGAETGTKKTKGAPLVVFRQKAGAMASVTGEKLGEAHVIAAMDRVVAEASDADLAPHLTGFCVAPVLPIADENDDSAGGAPRYLVAIEVAADKVGQDREAEERISAFARAFDLALEKENLEYEAKRNSLRLAPAIAACLPVGALAEHRAGRVAQGAPDAHVKIPHLSPDGSLLIALGLAKTAPDLAAELPCQRDVGTSA